MEETFRRSIMDVKAMRDFSDAEMRVFEEADAAAEELTMPEYEHYMNHEFNSEAIQIAKKHGLFGIPVPVEYGGLGLRPIIHSLVQMRLGQLGLGFATLYDVQTFIAENIILRWGNEEQKSRYLNAEAFGF